MRWAIAWSWAVAVVFIACSRPQHPREPLGALPSAVTSAEPLWVPFRVRAGAAVAPDPREAHFSELRRLTFDGKAGAPVWDGSDAIMMLDPGSCGGLNSIELSTGKVIQRVQRLPINSWTRQAEARCNDAHAEITPCWPAAGLVARTAAMVLDAFDCRLDLGGSVQQPAFGVSPSPDGQHIAFAAKVGADVEIFTASPPLAALEPGSAAAASVRQLTSLPGANVSPRFSPDGTSIVWAHAGKDGELHVWVAAVDGARPRQVTKDGKDNGQPCFLPDSRRILYASDRDSHSSPPRFSLYLIDPDGPVTESGGPRVGRITFAEGVDAQPMFSPDGKWLAFLSSRAGSSGLDLYVARWREP